MPSLFELSVTFLDGEFHGKQDGGEPEWPPSPLRLFQALVASAANRWQGSHFEAYAEPALRWLQGQAPPQIIAPDCHVGVPVRIAVPNNDLDVIASAWARGREPKKQPAELKTLKTVRPTRLSEGDTIFFHFDLPDPVPAEVRGHLETLASAARGIVALGWGIDLVAADGRVRDVNEATTTPGERWESCPDPSEGGLRIPVPGTLENLLLRHRAFLNRLSGGGYTPVAPVSSFAVINYRAQSKPAARPFAAFEIWKPADELATLPPGKSKFRPFDSARWAHRVAGMVRNAVDRAAEAAGWTDERRARFIHGHTSDGKDRATGAAADQRFAYLPLPSLERRGDRGSHVGMIRRVLVVAPPGGAAERGWVRRALSGQELFRERDSEPIALLSLISEDDRNLRGYVNSSRVWSTVTPIALPTAEVRNDRRAENLLRRSIEHAGFSPKLAREAELEWRDVGFRAGTGLAQSYDRPESSRRTSRLHVRIRWPVEIRGPLALGALRYRGLGVFAVETDQAG